MNRFDSKLNFIYLWIFVIYFVSSRPINAAFLDWIWTRDKNSEIYTQSNGPFISVPFEYKTEDEKFLEEASKFTDLMKTSSLDICQHKVILKIKSSCFQMSEEELAKMSVNLLNCQSEVDGRKIFPCSDSMNLKECTKDMDSDMWNAYHLMNNRARAICLAARRSQFQALSEMTVNKLMATAHDQINKMTSLLEGQEKLESLTLGTLDSITKGHDELMEQQESLKSSQKTVQDFVAYNLEQLTQEKALIAAGNKALAKMTENIKEKLDQANEQLINQAEERADNHRKLLNDIEALQTQAQDIFNRIDLSTEKLLAQHEFASLRYKDAVENLIKINDTVHYLLKILNTTRNEIDERFSWLQDLLHGTGNNLERLSSVTFHLAYLLLGMLFSSFLNLSTTSRAVLSVIVPLNLYVTYHQGSNNAMNFPQMTVLLGVTILVIAVVSQLVNFYASKTSKVKIMHNGTHPQINSKNESGNNHSNIINVPVRYFSRVYCKLSHSLNQLLSFIFGWVGKKSNKTSYQFNRQKPTQSNPNGENIISSSFSDERNESLKRLWNDHFYPRDEEQSAHSRVSEWLYSKVDHSPRPATPSSSARDRNAHGSVSDSDSGTESKIPVRTQRGRKNIRDIKELEDLNVDTRIANKNERERVLRIENIEKKFKDAFIGNELKDELILDYDFVNNVPLVSVSKVLVQKLKPHQKDGVKFMWNACYESVEQTKLSDGSGCILAHCMGLGKTLQVITLVHTLLNHQEVGTKKILIFCPKNTLMNWINEFHIWITPDLGFINIYNPTRFPSHSERLNELVKWYTSGGVCVMNYELFRNLLDDDIKDVQQSQFKTLVKFQECLCNPGPDLVICDEGHVLKNEDTKLSKTMNQIRTMRRIILTGTPLQNNLKEYHCMVQFVKPNLLGTRNEFTNMFVNPILNGAYENSLVEDVQLMKERSHILHKKLQGVVQRFDLTTLKSFLPDKQEYAIFVPLTKIQIKLYKFYLDTYSAKKDFQLRDSNKLLADYQSFQRIWTHPYTLKAYADNYKCSAGARKKSKRKKENSHNSESESSAEDESFQRTRYPLNFWVQFATSDDVQDPKQSNKFVLLLKILRECEEANEKLLIFSVSLYSLRMIEYFLKKINDSEVDDESLYSPTQSWVEEEDYLILTGDTSSEDRDKFCKLFNDASNTRLRLFLISTKAGGMGINLTAANRAILFDVSWNPSHDTQSIFRIYRIGQKKPCFVYRFVAAGTMEEKIYERQVTKQSISYRVVDEKQIARHYSYRELLGLYQFQPDSKKHKTDVKPKDSVLQKILTKESSLILGLHEHDSLLEHKEEEELQEMEKKDAWTAYYNNNNFKKISEAEKTMLSELTPESFDPLYLRMVLEKKFAKATDEEITSMMAQLMPRINEILQRRDFIDIMKRQALLSKTRHVKYIKASKDASDDGSKKSTDSSRLKRKKKLCFVDLTKDSPLKSTNLSDSSSSDDCIFLYNVGDRKKKKNRNFLKVWGIRGGKRYGSPDSDIEILEE